MNVQQWLKLVIDVLEFAIERIPTTTDEDTRVEPGQMVEMPPTVLSTQEKFPPTAPADSGPKMILDAEGIPWDERIHSSGKTFLTEGGCWKLKRGIDPVLVAKVKTELKIAQGAALSNGGLPQSKTVPPAPIDAITTWAQLMDKIAAAETHPETVLAACNKFNVANIGTLQDTPVLVPLVATELGF